MQTIRPRGKRYPLCLCLLLCLSSTNSMATSEQQLDAISRIGSLNAVALQCRFHDEVGTIKNALLRILPKKRELGVWFEKTTNDAFLDFMQEDKRCPEAERFRAQLQGVIENLESTFR